MNVEEILRLMGGFFMLLGIALSYWVNPWWILLSVFVALNLIQSAFSKWCPAMTILKKLGVKS
jgi:preprotein translocase subunit Sec63